MKKNCLSAFIFIFFLFINLAKTYAQQAFPNIEADSSYIFKSASIGVCSNDAMLINLRKNKNYRQQEEAMNQAILNAYKTLGNDTLTLPVVVHIINQNPNAITDAQVIAGIQDLNDAFSKSGAYSASLGADTKIRFCLSHQDPEGGNSTGITRTVSYFSNNMNMDLEDAKLKNLNFWDPQHFINIWLVSNIRGEAYADFVCGSWYRLGVGGYATLPPGGGAGDGIVVSGFGSLLAHEMGHYLGLYHTFQGGCSNFSNCLLEGDMVCDTPPDNSVRPSPSCSSPQNSCNTDTLANHSNNNFFTDVPDQIANFMDYGNGGCSNLFTQGQADRMHAAVLTQRPGLLVDECTQPCVENIVASFKRDVPYPNIGSLINFTNTAVGVANFEWTIDGVVVSNSPNFSYSFGANGKYKVTLKVYNTAGCFATYTDFVIVDCGVQARFFTDKKMIASKQNIYLDSMKFTNASFNATSYQWIMSNDQGMAEQVISTNTNFTYTFLTPGNYSIKLIATNGSCSDTSNTFVVNVQDPTADGSPYNFKVKCFNQNQVQLNFCIANYGFAALPKNTPINFYDANPNLSTANKLSPSFSLPSAVPGGNCANCFTHILNVAYANLTSIYLVFNDSGITIPVVLPNTPLVEKYYTNNTIGWQSSRANIFVSICQGQSYAGHNNSGVYIDTFVNPLNGCDSIRTLNLTIKPTFTTTVDTAICQGQSYAGHSSSGTFVNVFIASNGCDSTRTLHLIIKPKSFANDTAIICQGQNYHGHFASGNYTDTLIAANGCDSIVRLKLTVKPKSFSSINNTICQGQSFLGHNTTGIFLDTLVAANGCDSIRTVNLIVKPKSFFTLNKMICPGQIYLGYNATGIYVDTFLAANGCDSIRTLNLTVAENPTLNLGPDRTLCIGDTLMLDAGNYTSYLWQDATTQKILVVNKAGVYSVSVSNFCGVQNDTVNISEMICNIYFPNAFTPNKDGNNDIFKILTLKHLDDYSLIIYNRYGQKVFETKEVSKGWDGNINGEQQMPGSYIWVSNFKQDGFQKSMKGSVVLIR